jgi:inorganic pyrophosphatase
MPRQLLDELPSHLEVRIETPRGSLIKRSSDGGIDFVSPFPCPYNYGSVIGHEGGDGDPLDAVVLGRKLPPGTVRNLEVVGIIGFLDAGRVDHKVVFAEGEPTQREIWGLELFFRAYARVKRLRRPRQLELFGKMRSGGTRYLGWYAREDASDEVA